MTHGAAIASPWGLNSRRLFIPALLTAALAVASVASAQTPVANPTMAPPYLDRVLEAGPQQDAPSEQTQNDNLEGWARSLRVDYALASQRGPSESLSRAIALAAFLDTPNYGALSLSGNFTSSSTDTAGGAGGRLGSTGSTWHIDQWAMPLEGGWRANHSAGDINTIMPSLAHGIGRVFIPTSPISGLAGQWSRGDTLDLNLAVGRVGVFSGLDVSGFEPSAGHIISGGAQFQVPISFDGGRTDAAVQLVEARDIGEAGIPGGRQTRSTWNSLAWQGQAPWATGLGGSAADPMQLRSGGLRLQADWLHSTSTPGGAADGAWIDGAWRSDSLQNSAGVFRFDPNLRWGPSVVASDLQGAYWRAETASRQWNLGWDLEVDKSVSGLSGRSSFGSLYGRYRLDTRNALGTTLAMRRGAGAAQSMQMSWDRSTGLGQTQLRGSVMSSPQARIRFVGVDQAWSALAPVTLATSLGWEHSRGELATASSWSWGILAGLSPFAGLAIDASLRGARGNGAEALNISIGGLWQLQRNWSVAVRYSESRGQDPQTAQVVSALTAATVQSPFAPGPAQRTVQLVLRYEERAGSVTPPLGGPPGSGAGRLEGTVFLDANYNSRRDASEAGVPNVTVILDRRFVARTDARGHYEFPAVYAGEHQLQVQSDNVPLPWAPLERETVKLTIPIRGWTTHDFALQRDR